MCVRCAGYRRILRLDKYIFKIFVNKTQFLSETSSQILIVYYPIGHICFRIFLTKKVINTCDFGIECLRRHRVSIVFPLIFRSNFPCEARCPVTYSRHKKANDTSWLSSSISPLRNPISLSCRHLKVSLFGLLTKNNSIILMNSA